MIKIRPYQIEAISIIKETFKKKSRQYIEMPTGSGKTVTFLQYAKDNHDNVLIIVPSRQLMKQVYETALLFYEKKDISRKGDNRSENPKKLHICIINSIRGDYLEFLSKQKFDLIIFDEAHHIQADSYIRFIKFRSFNFPESINKILGVTATPDRADGLLLDEILGECSYKLSIESLIKDKFLSDIQGYSLKTQIDISDIDDHNGDFSLNQLYKKLSTKNRDDLIIDIIKNDMFDRKNIIFCINIEHSKHLSELLNNKGISSSHINGKTPENEKKVILQHFRNGSIQCLCNCQLLTEGFDEPSINGVILARPTKSNALFRQMIGRGLRIFPGKENCKIIDIVDNHKNRSGFNCLFTPKKVKELDKFDNFNEIKNYIEKLELKITEYQVVKTDLLSYISLSDEECTKSILDYLETNKIYYQIPLTFDEGSFLIWKHKLQQEYENGYN